MEREVYDLKFGVTMFMCSDLYFYDARFFPFGLAYLKEKEKTVFTHASQGKYIIWRRTGGVRYGVR